MRFWITLTIAGIYLLSLKVEGHLNAIEETTEYQNLQRSFKDSAERKEENGRISIGFCPDGTCDVVNTPLKVQPQDVADFLYLHFLYFSSFVVIKDWKNKNESKDIGKKILKRRTKDLKCRGIGQEAAKCVLRALSKKNDMRLEFVRYDEGTRNVTPVELP